MKLLDAMKKQWAKLIFAEKWSWATGMLTVNWQASCSHCRPVSESSQLRRPKLKKKAKEPSNLTFQSDYEPKTTLRNFVSNSKATIPVSTMLDQSFFASEKSSLIKLWNAIAKLNSYLQVCDRKLNGENRVPFHRHKEILTQHSRMLSPFRRQQDSFRSKTQKPSAHQIMQQFKIGIINPTCLQ